jgi:hypothetical protein
MEVAKAQISRFGKELIESMTQAAAHAQKGRRRGMRLTKVKCRT